MNSAPTEKAGKPEQPPEASPTETSKPVGDAIPTPVEPGLNEPLPEKNPAQSDRDKDRDKAAE
jgi:hypothetical protein